MKIKLTTIAQFLALALSFNVAADSLMQVYDVAKLNDPTILKSYAQFQKSTQAITSREASLLPQINLTGKTGYTHGLLNINSNKPTPDKRTLNNTNGQAILSLSQELYNGAVWQNMNVAEKVATEDEAKYGYEAQSLLLRTAQAYFAVLRAADGVKSIKANKRSVERQLEQTKQRFHVGLIAITDVHEAQAEYDRTVAEEITSENNLVNAYYGLRQLTGRDVIEVKYLNGNDFSPQKLEGSVKSWRNKALEYNLSLHSARIAKEVAKMQIRLAETGHEPTLRFDANATDNTNHFPEPDNGQRHTFADNATANAAIELNIPLYKGGGISSLVKEAEYGYVIASENLVENFRNTEAQVNSGYNNVRASISTITAYEQAVKSSRSALKATQAGFEVGTRTVVDVLDATRNLYSAENDLANGRYDYILNMLTLKLDAGTLEEKDLVSVSDALIASEPDIQ
ncbi:MAG: TolC family outer membrane protein [Psychromonas sp.]|nr:TolC family outer membrane protein [Psychromonas sp.]